MNTSKDIPEQLIVIITKVTARLLSESWVGHVDSVETQDRPVTHNPEWMEGDSQDFITLLKIAPNVKYMNHLFLNFPI